MYIPLCTIEEWVVGEGFSPQEFFRCVNHILLETDILVIGSYAAGNIAEEWLDKNSIEAGDLEKPYGDSFDLNRAQYPRAGSWELRASRGILEGLSGLCLSSIADNEKALFFDHVLAYRGTRPTLPLFEFHDAFYGGDLRLSGLYGKEQVMAFCQALGVEPRWQKNPEGA